MVFSATPGVPQTRITLARLDIKYQVVVVSAESAERHESVLASRDIRH
jgi:hypothetical protein